jgi:hypothetical protein
MADIWWKVRAVIHFLSHRGGLHTGFYPHGNVLRIEHIPVHHQCLAVSKGGGWALDGYWLAHLQCRGPGFSCPGWVCGHIPHTNKQPSSSGFQPSPGSQDQGWMSTPGPHGA